MAFQTRRSPLETRRSLLPQKERNRRNGPTRHRFLLRELQPQDRQAEVTSAKRGGRIPREAGRYYCWRDELGEDC